MVRPLQRRYSKTHPYVVERHDQEDGSITYEVWDYRPDTYRRLCSINEWDDGGVEDDEERELSTAKDERRAYRSRAQPDERRTAVMAERCLCPDHELRCQIYEIWTDGMNPSNRCLGRPAQE